MVKREHADFSNFNALLFVVTEGDGSLLVQLHTHLRPHICALFRYTDELRTHNPDAVEDVQKECRFILLLVSASHEPIKEPVRENIIYAGVAEFGRIQEGQCVLHVLAHDFMLQYEPYHE